MQWFLIAGSFVEILLSVNFKKPSTVELSMQNSALLCDWTKAETKKRWLELKSDYKKAQPYAKRGNRNAAKELAVKTSQENYWEIQDFCAQ